MMIAVAGVYAWQNRPAPVFNATFEDSADLGIVDAQRQAKPVCPSIKGRVLPLKTAYKLAEENLKAKHLLDEYLEKFYLIEQLCDIDEANRTRKKHNI